MILILLYELYEITTIENQSGKNLSLQIDHRQSPIKNFFLRKQVLLISASAEKPRTLARLFLKHFLKPWFQLHCTTFISRHAVNTKISNADVWFSFFFLKKFSEMFKVRFNNRQFDNGICLQEIFFIRLSK